MLPVLHSYYAEEPILDQTQSAGEPAQCLFLVHPVGGMGFGLGFACFMAPFDRLVIEGPGFLGNTSSLLVD